MAGNITKENSREMAIKSKISRKINANIRKNIDLAIKDLSMRPVCIKSFPSLFRKLKDLGYTEKDHLPAVTALTYSVLFRGIYRGDLNVLKFMFEVLMRTEKSKDSGNVEFDKLLIAINNLKINNVQRGDDDV